MVMLVYAASPSQQLVRILLRINAHRRARLRRIIARLRACLSGIQRHDRDRHGNVVCDLRPIPKMEARRRIIDIADDELLAVLAQNAVRDLDVEAETLALAQVASDALEDLRRIGDRDQVGFIGGVFGVD